MSESMSPDELWDLHGGSLLALARTLLGDESAAHRAVVSGLVSFFEDHDGSTTRHPLSAVARYVFAHSEWVRGNTSLAVFDAPGSSAGPAARPMTLSQRRMVALCLYGGHTCHEAAIALGISADTGARLMTTALRHRR